MFCTYWLYISIVALAEFHACLIDLPIASLWARRGSDLIYFCILGSRGRCLAQLGYFICCYSVVQLCPTLWDHKDCSAPGFLVFHYFLELAQTDVHWVRDAIQPSHPLSSPSPALTISQHQGLFKWVSSSHQVAKVLELQLQHQYSINIS